MSERHSAHVPPTGHRSRARSRRAARVLFLTLVDIGLPLSARSEPLRIDFTDQFQIDTSKFQTHAMDKPFYFSIHGPASPADAFQFTVDKATTFDVWLDRRTPPDHKGPQGDRSLAVRITAAYDENVKDKIMMQVNRHGGDKKLDVMRTGAPKFVSFDFMLDKDYETPHNWLLHFQAWQCCGGVPPFSIHVEPSANKHSDVEFVFHSVDDRQKQDDRHARGQEIYRMRVNRNEWNNMTLLLDPSFDDNGREGEIAMWWNGAKKFNWRGSWGFRPVDFAPDFGRQTTRDITLHLGTYRRRQTTTQTIYFDHVRFGDSFEEVR